MAGGSLGPVHRLPRRDEGGPRSFPRACGQRLIDMSDADAHIPEAAAERVEGHVHHLRRLVQDALDLIAHRAFKRPGCPAQTVKQLGHAVYVGAAAALVDGQNVHASTVNGLSVNINHLTAD